MLFPLATLAIAALELTDTSGVKLSCLENVRGKTGRGRIEIVVGAGSLDEGEKERGLAHLVEHVVMRPLGFDHENAETALDYTTFYRDVRATDLSTTAIDLVEALAKVSINQHDFELEREVVRHELELRDLP